MICIVTNNPENFYGKFSKISNTVHFMIIRAGIHKMFVRIANREDTDQTSSSDPYPGSAMFVHAIVACN